MSQTEPAQFRIAQMLREHAAAHPEAPALICAGRVETYGELDRRSSQIANYLLGAGAGAGDRVAHLDRNSPETAELLFACAKIGAAVVPLNWRLTAVELTELLRDAEVQLLFCGPEFAGLTGELSARLPGLRESLVLEPGDDACLAGPPHRTLARTATSTRWSCSSIRRAPPACPKAS